MSLSSVSFGSQESINRPPRYVRMRSRSTPHVYLQHRNSYTGQQLDLQAMELVRLLGTKR